jgi:hypothetical protein
MVCIIEQKVKGSSSRARISSQVPERSDSDTDPPLLTDDSLVLQQMRNHARDARAAREEIRREMVAIELDVQRVSGRVSELELDRASLFGRQGTPGMLRSMDDMIRASAAEIEKFKAFRLKLIGAVTLASMFSGVATALVVRALTT